MSILIEDPEILAIINTQMALGHYKNPDEVIRSALSAMETQEEQETIPCMEETFSPEEVIWIREKLQEALDSIATEGTLSGEEVFAPYLNKNIAAL